MRWVYLTDKEKFDARVDKECKWHTWFAWYPVTVVFENSHYRVWLERVGRKRQLLDGYGNYGHADEIVEGEYCFYEDLFFKILSDPESADGRCNNG